MGSTQDIGTLAGLGVEFPKYVAIGWGVIAGTLPHSGTD